MRRWLVFVVLGGLLLVLLLPGVPALSYVYSESMEPTISVGDGYVLVPAGDVEPGDIVTFRSEYRDERVTHRVVAAVDGGYLTRGDNNPSTDQATGHPVVTEEAIVGEVLSVGGGPVVIPNLRGISRAISAYWPVLAVAVLVGGSLLDRNPRVRDVVRVRDLLGPLALTAVGGSVVVLAYSAPTYAMSFVAVVSGTGGDSVLVVGESATRTLEVAAGPAFTYQFVAGDGVTVLDVVAGQSGSVVDVLVPAQSAPGSYAAAVTTYHYPAVLPYGVTGALHGMHPVAAALGSVLALVTPLLCAVWFVVDGREPLVSRSRARTPWWGSR